MNCKHERLICTDNVLRCAVCGAVLPLSVLGDKSIGQKENAAEGPKKPAKRKTKKEAK